MSIDPAHTSIDRWFATWRALGVEPTAALRDAYDALVARYAEPHRKYHTLRHLEDCFTKLEEIRDLAGHPADVELALWYHDAIYDTRSTRNEALSANLAAGTATDAGVDAARIRRIEDLVLATRHAAIPADPDATVLVDVDLSILGALPQAFDRYEQQVREEYGWGPGLLYRRERRKILRAFLARPAIFGTPPFRERYEPQARANIEQSLKALGG